MKYADMQKTIYSLPPLRELLLAANRGYLEFLSAMEDNTAGTDKLNKISRKAEDAAPIAASTSSMMKTKNYSNPWPEASSISAASKVKIFAGDCRIKPAARSHAC